MNINEYGWSSYIKRTGYRLPSGFKPARIIADYGRGYKMISNEGPLSTTLVRSTSRPAAGDWVLIPAAGEPVIREVLPRTNAVSRKEAGNRTAGQILAANIDYILLIFSAGEKRKHAPGMTERYAALAWDSGAVPLIVLNKIDKNPQWEEAAAKTEYAAPGIDVVPVSCLTGEGIVTLSERMKRENTYAVLGPSGAGKSSLINRLAGTELAETGDIRASDGRGRHTTAHRELFLLPEGALIMDTPGLRELGLWIEDEGLGKAFPDIAELALSCRFADCRHEGEPGCAVTAALSEGLLDFRRYENYKDLQREIEYTRRKSDMQAKREHKEKWKKIAKDIRKINKHR